MLYGRQHLQQNNQTYIIALGLQTFVHLYIEMEKTKSKSGVILWGVQSMSEKQADSGRHIYKIAHVYNF